MFDKFRKIWRNRWVLRSILSSIYFNFHYLPFKQAIKLPILLYKPKLIKCNGKIVIVADNIHTGMIILGVRKVSIYRNSGIIFENSGGTIVFTGNCCIGNDSAIAVGNQGRLVIGAKFCATAALRLVCYNEIKFGDKVLVGWDCIFMDTDFHKLTRVVGTGYSKGYGKIVIGSNNWFGCKCTVLKNTKTSDYISVGSNSLLNKEYDFPSYSVIAGNPVKVFAQGLYLNRDDDKIDYGEAIYNI